MVKTVFLSIKQALRACSVLIVLLILVPEQVRGQYETKRDAEGSWTDPSNWKKDMPRTTVNGNVTVNGEISLGQEGAVQNLIISSGKLVVKGELVVYGDLDLKRASDLEIKKDGILVVMGSVSSVKHVSVASNGVFVIKGDYKVLISSNGNGVGDSGFTSSKYPAQVYIGGEIIPPNVKKDPLKKFPVLKPGKHEDFSDLEEKQKVIYDKYFGFHGGEIEGAVENNCGFSEVTLNSKSLAGPGKVKVYKWYYSTTSNDPSKVYWDEIPVGTEVKFKIYKETTCYCYRYAKKNENNEANSPVINIQVKPNPVPHPIGIFHD